MLTTTDQLYTWVKNTCDKCNVSELYQYIRVKWNNRFTNHLGRARYVGEQRLPMSCTIELSNKLWDRATPTEQYEIVVHETCHLIAFYLYGITNINKEGCGGHGPSWISLMKHCGVKPERYHNVCTRGLRKQRNTVSRYEIQCGCRNLNYISAIRRTNMIQKEIKYRCRACKQDIVLTGKCILFSGH